MMIFCGCTTVLVAVMFCVTTPGFTKLTLLGIVAILTWGRGWVGSCTSLVPAIWGSGVVGRATVTGAPGRAFCGVARGTVTDGRGAYTGGGAAGAWGVGGT